MMVEYLTSIAVAVRYSSYVQLALIHRIFRGSAIAIDVYHQPYGIVSLYNAELRRVSEQQAYDHYITITFHDLNFLLSPIDIHSILQS